MLARGLSSAPGCSPFTPTKDCGAGFGGFDAIENPEFSLNWETRKYRLLREIVARGADLITAQEVSQDATATAFVLSHSQGTARVALFIFGPCCISLFTWAGGRSTSTTLFLHRRSRTLDMAPCTGRKAIRRAWALGSSPMAYRSSTSGMPSL